MKEHLGAFEQLVLLAVLRLENNAYGVTIQREIARRANRDSSIGTIYKSLGRLEAQGYLRSEIGDPTPERGGRRKKYYRLQAPGYRALVNSLRAVRGMVRGLPEELRIP